MRRSFISRGAIIRRFLLFLSMFLFISGAFVKAAVAQETGPVVTLAPEGDSRIRGLLLRTTSTEVRVLDEPGKPRRVVALIDGKFDKQDWSLVFQTQPVDRNEAGRFRFWFPLRGPHSTLELIAVSPFGEVEKMRLTVRAEGVEFGQPEPPEENQRVYFYSAGLGLSVLSYHQTGIDPVDQIAVTGKMSIVRAFSPSWDIGLSGYVTVLPLITGSEDTARFLGLNARVGYALPFVQAPWKVAILAGGYYTTMFSSEAFGFRNMMGPQLFPTLRRVFSDGGSMWLYGKFSPVSDGGMALSFTNRELALGGGLAFKPVDGRSITLTLDVAELALKVGEAEARSTSVSVGIGLNF